MGGNLFWEDLMGSCSVPRWRWHPWIGACLASSRCHRVCHGGKGFQDSLLVDSMCCGFGLCHEVGLSCTLLHHSGVPFWRALECGEMLMDPGIACCSWYRWNPPPAHHWSCCLGLHLIIPSVKWGDYSAYCIWWVRWCMRGDVWCMRDDIHEVMYESPPGPPRSLISSPCMLNTRTKSVIQVGSGRWGAGGLDWVLAYFTDEKTEASPLSPVVTLLVCIIALLSCLVTMVT